MDQLIDAVKTFFTKLTVNRNFRNRWTAVITGAAIFAFSLIMTALGKDDLGPTDILMQVLDSVGVVQIICAFIFTWVWNRLTQKACTAVVNHMPEAVRSKVNALSDRGNAWADRQDSKMGVTPRTGGSGHEPEMKKPPTGKEPPEDYIKKSMDFLRAAAVEFVDPSKVTPENVMRVIESDPGLREEWNSLGTDAERSVFIERRAPDIIMGLAKL